MRTAEAPAGSRARILVVEDEAVVQALLGRILTGEGYAVVAVATGEEALERLGRELFDLVLLDLNLPGMDGMQVLSAAPALQTDAQFIVMTAFGSVDTAVEAMKLGALDYINKPFRTEELLLILERAIQARTARREAPRDARGAPRRRGVFLRIIGESAPMQRLFELVERVAPMRTSVLITGDTGTGKELIARAVHELSPRASAPFVAVNCSALPESLLESELFGHVKGSFTGAVANKRGLIQEANGGTLFLDEIATLSLPIQVKLLRVLQERQIKQIGGNQLTSVDFRLVAATNVDLEQEVAAGRFRADLHYRLDVFPIRVPSLQERCSDLPLLVRHFSERFAKENGIECPVFTPETLSRMMQHSWPGNIRELENFIERALIMHAGSSTIPFDIPASARIPADERAGAERLLAEAETGSWSLSRFERELILRALRRTSGHRSAAAGILGVHPRTLTRKLRQYAEDGVLPADLAAGGEP
jgi:two-component system, NtrC family, response regulator PilR